MKVKNLTERNVSIIANRVVGTIPFRLIVPALSTMEFNDEDWYRVADRTKGLVEAGVLQVIDAPETPLTATEICGILEKEDVKVNPKLGKKKLQKMATDLGVDLEKKDIKKDIKKVEA